jgi:hypothetical protein
VNLCDGLSALGAFRLPNEIALEEEAGMEEGLQDRPRRFRPDRVVLERERLPGAFSNDCMNPSWSSRPGAMAWSAFTISAVVSWR